MTRPRATLRQRLHARWRRSPFNPYILDQRLLVEAMRYFGPRLEGRMLDVGCGERPYSEYFPSIGRYVGIEHLGAVTNIDKGLERSVAHVAHVVDAFAEGEHLPFRDASFDCCIATEVLEHVAHPVRVVDEMARVTRDGGLLFVTVPFVGELHQIPFDFRRYTKFGLARLLDEAGFEVLEIRARGNFVVTAGRVLAHAIYRCGAKELKPDGAVRLHRLAIPFVLPLSALTLMIFRLLGRFSRDESRCLGDAALARRRPRTTPPLR